LRDWSSQCRDRIRELLTDDAFSAAYECGQRLSVENTVSYALEESPEPAAEVSDPQPGAVADPLTKRERQVANLIADGLTNKQIADRLVITDRTVTSHVEHIMKKLGVHRRTQIAALMQQLAQCPVWGRSTRLGRGGIQGMARAVGCMTSLTVDGAQVAVFLAALSGPASLSCGQPVDACIRPHPPQSEWGG
jgi:DNA-binding CsgD family transcriptional regulator